MTHIDFWQLVFGLVVLVIDMALWRIAYLAAVDVVFRCMGIKTDKSEGAGMAAFLFIPLFAICGAWAISLVVGSFG